MKESFSGSTETRKENGEYFVADEQIEDNEGNVVETTYRKVSKDEYRAARKESRRESREFIKGELLSMVGVKSEEEKKFDEEQKAKRAAAMGKAGYDSAMKMGARPAAPGFVKLDGQYYREKGTYEDEDGNEEVSGWEKVSKEEYKEAKRNLRRERIALVRESFKKIFRRKKNGEDGK